MESREGLETREGTIKLGAHWKPAGHPRPVSRKFHGLPEKKEEEEEGSQARLSVDIRPVS